MRSNLILTTDSYKIGHWNMMPKGIEGVYSYFEARTGALYNNVVFFGLQHIIREYLQGYVLREEDIDEADVVCQAHFGTDKLFNRAMWEYTLKRYGGKLPIRIRAVKEGTPVPVNNVLMTVENTDPKCYQLTNHFETLLSNLWYPSTVCTLSYELKKLLKFYLDKTANDDSLLKFQLHDFGCRGATVMDAAALGGAAHLVNFMGTDTLPAMQLAQRSYDAKLSTLAFSVPATEHSVMTSRGEAGEAQLLGELLDEYPSGILSVVIDSYDYKNFIQIAGLYKERIAKRQGKLVFRPDSGDPIATTMDVLDGLNAFFPATINKKGYKKLPDCVGVLWGDGLDYQLIRSILFTMRNNGWASDNIVFGMGGGLLQKVNRDTQRFAFKSSAQKVNGEWHDVFKKPLDSSKASKRGRLMLVNGVNGFQTVPEGTVGATDLLETVFENGELKRFQTLEEIRALAAL